MPIRCDVCQDFRYQSPGWTVPAEDRQLESLAAEKKMSAHGHMGVSKNNDTPKSSILIGFSIINHPFWGTSIFENTHMVVTNVLGQTTTKT